MSLRKEHVVLIGTLAVLALLYFAGGPSRAARATSAKNVAAPEFEEHAAPSTALSLPEKRRLDDLDRDVFAPPRDTRPLPPLELVPPPLPTLTALAPPPGPAFDARLFGKFLRADPTPVSVPDLFVASDAENLADLREPVAPDESVSRASAKKEQAPQLSPAEAAALRESWKQLYDWISLDSDELMFGQIRNPDRYGLSKRASEAILFVPVEPTSGAEKFPGMKPAPYERARVKQFAFADTPSNRIQLRRRELADEQPGPLLYANLLALADECVAQRFVARDALPVAEEAYRHAAELEKDDPTAQLGLARCFEVGFQFEKAYEQYDTLLARYAHRPEVHVRLGELEARLRMFDSAEERFQHAEQLGGKKNWRVQWPYGRFLAERGRYSEALPHLQVAYDEEPQEPNEARTRGAIRTDLGLGRLALGQLDEAVQACEKALQADASDTRPLAGKVSALRLGAKGTAPAAGAAGQTAGFDLLLARALDALKAKEWVAARDGLVLAATTSPLRAPQAWRALSWLAEITGYPDSAARWIERAYEGDPTDAWTLYQAGRLFAQRDDVQSAREAFVRALDQELDFADALVGLAELSNRTGNYAAAERYYERALALDKARAEVHAMRGINAIQSGDLQAARDTFDAALAIDPLQPLARAGQAWVTYRSGDPDKAIQQFAELNDVRRSSPESDPYRVYAKAQMTRIQEHTSKVIWSDSFERLQLKNGWEETDQAAGPTSSLVDGALQIEGVFDQNGTVRVVRDYAAQDFVALELDVTVPSSNNSKVGVFVAKERRTGSGVQVQSKIGVARRADGALVVLLMDTATAEEIWEDVPPIGSTPWWPADRPVRIRIEKVGEGNEALGRIAIDGIPVREGFKLPRLAASTNDVKLGVFVQGQTGLPAKVVVDNVDIIKRIRK